MNKQIKTLDDFYKNKLDKFIITPEETDHKYSRGIVSLYTGSKTYPGAGFLSLSGSLKSGAGMVHYLGNKKLGKKFILRAPEILLKRGKTDCCVLGCGFDKKSKRNAKKIINKAFRDQGNQDTTKQFFIIDAGALNLLAKTLRKQKNSCPASNILITPHKKEFEDFYYALFAKHIGEKTQNYGKYVHELVDKTGISVLLKGHETTISDENNTYKISTSTNYMATAGMGDVLAGILGTLFAQNVKQAASNKKANSAIDVAGVASCAVCIHNLAARLAAKEIIAPTSANKSYKAKINLGEVNGSPITASDVLDNIQNAIWILNNKK